MDKYTFDKKTGVAQIIDGIEVLPMLTIVGNQKIKTLIIPEGVKELKFGSIMNLRKLQKVILPSTLKTIASGAFCACRNAEIELPDTIETIGIDGFVIQHGKLIVNAKNMALVKQVEDSLVLQKYKKKQIDDKVIFEDLYSSYEEISIEEGWRRIYESRRKAKDDEGDND